MISFQLLNQFLMYVLSFVWSLQDHLSPFSHDLSTIRLQSLLPSTILIIRAPSKSPKPSSFVVWCISYSICWIKSIYLIFFFIQQICYFKILNGTFPTSNVALHKYRLPCFCLIVRTLCCNLLQNNTQLLKLSITN